MTQPLVIDATPADIHVVQSALGLRNRATVMETIRHNDQLKQSRIAASRKRFEPGAELIAEYIRDSENSTKTRNVDDYIRHSNISLPTP